MRRLILFFSSLVLLLSSCERDLLQNRYSPLDGHTASNERIVNPGETDERLKHLPGTNKLQLAYVPQSLAKGKGTLFIMIPGTLGEPKDYKLILKAAAENGYHSLSIDYNNRQTVKSICEESNDPACSENALHEYLTGDNTSGDVSIAQAESFENRISKMLVYLNETYPDDLWQQYLTPQGEVIWNKISLAGHSQGGTHALYISKKRNLARASFFSSPYGFESNGKFPDWLTSEGLTSTNNLYAFIHRADKLMDWNEVNKTWDAIGMVNANRLLDVHDDLKTFHRFYTQFSNGLGLLSGVHGSTCVDSDTPKDRNRNPKFRKVWAFMCFPE